MHQLDYVVSACLAGVACRYDGKDNAHSAVMELVAQGRAILVCPEQLGGMATPRAPSEIQTHGAQGSVCQVLQKADAITPNDTNSTGTDSPTTAPYTDVTDAFSRGAHEALRIAKLAGCTKAITKARSPSCGCGLIYDGSFSKVCVAGNGIFAQALLDAGFTVWTEETWEQGD